MVMPKQDIQDIVINIEKRILSVEQYEFICLRLIDSIKQIEDKANSYEKALRDISNINIYNLDKSSYFINLQDMQNMTETILEDYNE